MATTTAADLAAGQIAMVAEARLTYEHTAVCTNLFNRMTMEQGEKSKYVPKFGSVTAYDLTDGVDMADSQTMTITGTTHTTDEAGCKVIITKKLRHQLKADAYTMAGKVIGQAMGRKIDKDGLGLFSGINSGLGGATTSITLGHIAAAVSQCMGQAEPVPDPYFCVLHPYTINLVVDALSNPAATYAAMPADFQKKVLQGYLRGGEKLYGVPIFGDGNITITSDAAYGFLGSKLAFIYLVGWEPENWVEEDKSLRGWEIGIVADYAMVEEDGGYGRYMYFYAQNPTA